MNTGLQNQDLTGALPAGVGDLGPALKRLSLGDNQISGELPTELGTLTGLTSLRLESNAITAVPTNIRALTGLTILYLQRNAITAVPTEVGALTGLRTLALEKNDLTSLPTEIGALTGLTLLDLREHAITSLPTEIGALTNLEILDLGDNQLTGVPAEFRTVDPSDPDADDYDFFSYCYLFNNPSFSCANVGFDTSCCTQRNCGDTATCYTEE